MKIRSFHGRRVEQYFFRSYSNPKKNFLSNKYFAPLSTNADLLLLRVQQDTLSYLDVVVVVAAVVVVVVVVTAVFPFSQNCKQTQTFIENVKR